MCAARSDCEAAGCPLCAGKLSYSGCYKKGETPDLACPAVACESACGAHGDEKSCDDDSACYALFIDGNTCDCNTPGCCMVFSYCADGAGTSCEPLPTPFAGPACTETTVCGPGCARSYSAGLQCAEGCVRDYDCLEGGE